MGAIYISLDKELLKHCAALQCCFSCRSEISLNSNSKLGQTFCRISGESKAPLECLLTFGAQISVVYLSFGREFPELSEDFLFFGAYIWHSLIQPRAFVFMAIKLIFKWLF